MKVTRSLRRVKHIHFIGIGGSGMGGIAEVLLTEGFIISGSDKASNAVTTRLAKLGASIYRGHSAAQVDGADAVVVSSAVDKQNPELIAARKARIPVLPRAVMLAELMRFRVGITIAGTHGKTTTTSLVASLMAEAGLDPTFVIGGLLNQFDTHARLGSGEYLVAEADESDASFLHLNPVMAVVTNIDRDHMVQYEGNFENLKKTFIEYLHRLPFYGLAVLCLEDSNVRSILPKIERPVLTYGFGSDADVRAVNINQKGMQTRFTVKQAKHQDLDLTVNLAGEHNVLNALAALAIARECGVNDQTLKEALVSFQGVGRRMEVHGTFTLSQNRQITLIDDYGHHPKEVAVTLAALRAAWPSNRIVVVFQPHRYTRTLDLFDDFIRVLSTVDVLLLLEVYSAGEAVIPGAESRDLVRTIRAQTHLDPTYLADEIALCNALDTQLQDGDVVILQGAGSIGQLVKTFVHYRCQFNEISKELAHVET